MTTSAQAPADRPRRHSPRVVVGLLAAAMVAIRLPAFFASAHLSFDDGVFGASAVAMRHGGVPFRDVFSSQGPLFLPLVWVGDTLGLHTSQAPRLLGVAAGVATAVGVYFLVRRLTSAATTPILTAVVVGTSGSVLWTTGALAADGPTFALAVGAVAALYAWREHPTRGRAIAVGALIGAAFAIKSLFAIPPGLAIAWVFLGSRRWSDLLAAVSAAAVVVLVVAVPWGVGAVWDQAVVYHLEAASDRTPGANAQKIVTTLWDRDLLLFVLALGAIAVAGASARRPSASPAPRRPTPSPLAAWGGPLTPIAIWLAAVVLVLLVEHPMWRPHLGHLVPPLAVLAGVAWEARPRAFVAVTAVVAVAHAVTVAGIVVPSGYEGPETRASSDLAALPDDVFVISDEPGFVWRAGLRTPDDLVDTSMLRIDSGRITRRSLIADAADPAVCAVLVWSHRFADLDVDAGLAEHGYALTRSYGGPRRLWVRGGCVDAAV